MHVNVRRVGVGRVGVCMLCVGNNERIKIYTQHVPLRQSAEEEVRGKLNHNSLDIGLTDEELLLSTFCVDEGLGTSNIPSASSAGNHTGTGLFRSNVNLRRPDSLW